MAICMQSNNALEHPHLHYLHLHGKKEQQEEKFTLVFLSSPRFMLLFLHTAFINSGDHVKLKNLFVI